ncbi:MAG: hypothetical protein ABIG63_07810, partial [Chloroflexota bacterium]
MSDFNSEIPDEVIRISRKEANSPHVDDLLKRQMSLRGELGVARSHERHWYYQNWFVFMIVATIAGIGGWATIEPFFDDLLYFQGKIEQVNISEEMPSRINLNDVYIDMQAPSCGFVVIKGQRIWLLEEVKELKPDGTKVKLDLTSLQQNQEIGVHVSYIDLDIESLALCSFVDRSPPVQSPTRTSMTLSQLSARSHAAAILLFPVVAGFIGLAIGAVDGVICRLFRRALLCGVVGLLLGFIGGFISSMLAGLIYMPLNRLAMDRIGETMGSLTSFGFFVQMTGRGLAWCMAG